MMARKDKVVQRPHAGHRRAVQEEQDRPACTGTARLVARRSRRGRAAPTARPTLETARILIATGSEPIALPGLPFDGERIVSSTEALALPQVPKRLLVVGAGAIGLELGSVWRRLGAEVTVVEFLDRIVPWAGRDDGASSCSARSRSRASRFRLSTQAEGGRAHGRRRARDARPDRASADVDADVVLVAVGRRPYTEGLGARELGVAFDERGRIVVNEHFETNVAGRLRDRRRASPARCWRTRPRRTASPPSR